MRRAAAARSALWTRGCLRGVDAVFGAHVSPELPLGSVGIRYGKFYAASDTFSITVHGKSAHGAEPEKGIDALQAAAQLAVRLTALSGTALNGERCAVTVGTLQAGTAVNVVADTAQLTGILRTLGPDSRARMRDAGHGGGGRVSPRRPARRSMCSCTRATPAS